jgi:hypothetical protein
MSLKKTAASTSYRRSGWRVISVMMSGVEHAAVIVIPARALWYSGRDRPAWRMYQTGVRGTGWRRQARTNKDSAVEDVTP